MQTIIIIQTFSVLQPIRKMLSQSFKHCINSFKFSFNWKVTWIFTILEETFSHFEVSTFGSFDDWQFLRLAVSTFGSFDDWQFLRLAVSTFGSFDVWQFRRLAVSTIGNFDVWQFRRLAVSTFDSFDESHSQRCSGSIATSAAFRFELSNVILVRNWFCKNCLLFRVSTIKSIVKENYLFIKLIQ